MKRSILQNIVISLVVIVSSAIHETSVCQTPAAVSRNAGQNGGEIQDPRLRIEKTISGSNGCSAGIQMKKPSSPNASRASDSAQWIKNLLSSKTVGHAPTDNTSRAVPAAFGGFTIPGDVRVILPQPYTGISSTSSDPVTRPPDGQAPDGTAGRGSKPQRWVTIMSEDFGDDGAAFSDPRWRVGINSGHTNAMWGSIRYYPQYGVPGLAGGHYAWCAAAGTQAGTIGHEYPNNMFTYMIFGPFDLSDAVHASLSFKYRNDSETSYDFLWWAPSIDGTHFPENGRISGPSGNVWRNVVIELTNWPTLGTLVGRSQVWIAFVFESDIRDGGYGAFIDDVVLEKDVELPDLEPSYLALDPNPGEYYWNAGCTKVRGTYRERNNGGVTAPPHSSEIFLSDGVRRYALTSVSVPAIPPGFESQPVSFEATVPVDIPYGEWVIYAEADHSGTVDESDEDNVRLYSTDPQKRASIRPIAELEWTNITTSSGWDNWKCGDRRTVSVRVKNNGSADAPAHRTRLILSADGKTPLETLAERDFSAGIPAGESVELMFPEFTIPQLPPGKYALGAVVDFQNTVRECDEDNNGGYTDVFLTISAGYADITVSATPARTSWTAGGAERITIRESNTETGSAASHKTNLYLSSNPSINEHLLTISPIQIPPIAAGGNYQTEVDIVVPQQLPSGYYYLIAVADVNGEVNEQNLSNNRYAYASQIIVSRPQGKLVLLQDVVNCGTVVIGQAPGTGTFSVRNEGNGDLILDNFVISGSDKEQFKVTTALPVSIPPSSTRTVEISFTPSGNAGARSATLTFSSTDPANPSKNVGLIGVAQTGSSGRLLISDLNILFDSIDVGYTKTREIIIKNDSNSELLLYNPQLSGDWQHFKYVDFQNRLSPGALFIMKFLFTPAWSGWKQGEFTFRTTEANNPEYRILLSGYARTTVYADQPEVPPDGTVLLNYPNPFSDHTNIRFNLNRDAHVSLEIHDAMGKLVMSLDREHRAAGLHSVVWQANGLPSGVYRCTVTAENRRIVRLMHLIR